MVFEHVETVLTFLLHVALVTVCMKRRSKGAFPITAVIGAWLMASASTLGIADLVIGSERLQAMFSQMLGWFGIQQDPDPFASPSLMNYFWMVSVLSLLGYLLLAIGIYRLAQRRMREAMTDPHRLPEGP